MCENTFVYYALLYLTEKHAVHFKYIKYNLRMYIYWYILTKKKKKKTRQFFWLSPQSQLYMHLTNYSVNKHNENFERDETVDKGSKRSVSWFTEFLRSNDYDVAKFWGDISVCWCFTETCMDPFVRFIFHSHSTSQYLISCGTLFLSCLFFWNHIK